MKSRKPFGIYLLASLALAGCTFHPPAPPSKEERERQFAHCFREEMQPTDEQVKLLEEKVFRADSDVQKAGEDLRRESDELERQLENPAAHDPELLDHFHRVSALRARMSEDHFRRMLLLRNVLTDDQKRRFLACKRKLGPPSLPQD